MALNQRDAFMALKGFLPKSARVMARSKETIPHHQKNDTPSAESCSRLVLNPKQIVFLGEGLEQTPSGLLLDKMIQALGLEASETIVLKIIPKHMPACGQSLVEVCLEHFTQVAKSTPPRAIVVLGAESSAQFFSESFSQLRGKNLSWNGVFTLVTTHPSKLIDVPSEKKPAWEDLKRLASSIGLNLAEKSSQPKEPRK